MVHVAQFRQDVQLIVTVTIIITSALKCVSLAAQKLRRMFIVIPGAHKSRRKKTVDLQFFFRLLLWAPGHTKTKRRGNSHIDH